LYALLGYLPLRMRWKEVGKSLIDTTMIAQARAIHKKAAHMHVAMHFPLDYQVAQDALSGPLSVVSATQFPKNSIGISIGPKSIDQFRSVISQAQLVFFNGSIGFIERPVGPAVSLVTLVKAVPAVSLVTFCVTFSCVTFCI
jgi:phosphoglycerate kinase